MSKIVFVLHRQGWCATKRVTTQYKESVKTKCGYTVTAPFGLIKKSLRQVNENYLRGGGVVCPECTKIINAQRPQNLLNKFCPKCLKSTRLVYHNKCHTFTQRR